MAKCDERARGSGLWVARERIATRLMKKRGEKAFDRTHRLRWSVIHQELLEIGANLIIYRSEQKLKQF